MRQSRRMCIGGRKRYAWGKYNAVATNTYIWNRYNTIATVNYTWKKYSTTISSYSLYWSTDTTEISLSSSGVYDLYCYSSYSFSSSKGMTVLTGNKKKISYVWNGGFEGSYPYFQYNSVTYRIYSSGGEYSNPYFNCNTAIINPNYAKGTYIEDITSTSSSAYPDDGAQGGYWYVKQSGTTTTYSKGTTQYSDVSSTNRSAYPDDSYSGSYWYVYSTYTTSYSSGTFIETVYSYDESAYPANARHTDGYWYTAA